MKKIILLLSVIMLCLTSYSQVSVSAINYDYGSKISISGMQILDENNLILFGTDINGFCIIKSIDGGLTWDRYYTDEDVINVKFINNMVGYYTSGKYTYIQGSGYLYTSYLYQTIDGGLTYNIIYTFNDKLIYMNIINDDIILLNDMCSVYKSIDGGNTFLCNKPDEHLYINDTDGIQIMSENIIYIIKSTMIYKTIDGGLTWDIKSFGTNSIIKTQYSYIDNNQLHFTLSIDYRLYYEITNVSNSSKYIETILEDEESCWNYIDLNVIDDDYDNIPNYYSQSYDFWVLFKNEYYTFRNYSFYKLTPITTNIQKIYFDINDLFDVYSIDGKLIMQNININYINKLSSGIYIIKNDRFIYKINIE
jgi:hypothetical protein